MALTVVPIAACGGGARQSRLRGYLPSGVRTPNQVSRT